MNIEELKSILSDGINNTWNNKVSADYHQYSALPGEKNIKYVDSTGRIEAIYDKNGNYVSDPRDIGTYNFMPSDGINPFISKNEWHYKLDMLPWYEWGNSTEDTTTYDNRANKDLKGKIVRNFMNSLY